MKKTTYLVQGALIAAIYVVLALALAEISFGPWQVRIAEALTVLPYLTPVAIPGVFVGCLIANFFSPFGILDVILGSLATLIAAVLTYRMPKRWLAPLPPVLVNTFVIPILIYFTANEPVTFWFLVAQIFIGQVIACYGFGYYLLLILERYKLLQR
ncbi:QueT transporter family protein [Anaerobranca gottschalkii]|uniref:Uncharacterized membrane protein n=1 Tax=Anaerobranca gottschalkii DSM 13577 TaxID=1120990 RepID=A0A1I0AUB8_9FIRM|nr:QueT transporter family protein [Anaerobranca gottschalkii]SES98019.1 Uncharacterized membrane protein [Anaerobranca gottschalkii DSM 13577]